ncbi:MAG TPA: hypothetical protein VMM79_06755 [Longimicrobiales bacterium]|nr:hypothetical protein [Longimicrobiales bacterium]
MNEQAISSTETQARARLRRVFTRVMIVQVISLLLLWLLQTTYGTG